MNLAHLVGDIPLRQTFIICSKILRPELPITRHTTLQTNKKEEETTASHFYSLSRRTGTNVCLYVCDGKRGGEEEIEMKQSSPYVKSDWNILAISHRV